MRKSKIAREQKRMRKLSVTDETTIEERAIMDAFYQEMVTAHNASKVINESIDKTISESDKNSDENQNTEETNDSSTTNVDTEASDSTNGDMNE